MRDCRKNFLQSPRSIFIKKPLISIQSAVAVRCTHALTLFAVPCTGHRPSTHVTVPPCDPAHTATPPRNPSRAAPPPPCSSLCPRPLACRHACTRVRSHTSAAALCLAHACGAASLAPSPLPYLRPHPTRRAWVR